MARRFEESSKNFSGSKTASSIAKSDYTLLREKAMMDIYDFANKKGKSLDDVLTRLLTNAQSELRAYVSMKGETPVSDPTGLALQAAMIRATDVATAARVMDTDDETALQTIEGAESDSISLNSPERDSVLTPVTAGAIACVLQYMNEQSGGKSMASIVKSIHQLGKYAKSNANNLDNIGDPSNVSDWTDWTSTDTVSDPTDVAAADTSLNYTSIGSTLASIPATGGDISVASGIPTISTNASNLPQAGDNTSSGGVLNAITSIFGGITKAAAAVQQAASSTTGAAGAVKNSLSGIGAGSISQYLQNNWPIILLILVAVIFAIYFAVHAARK